ncbi:pentapeptide repeat-containing protein [Trichormus variabilis]|uniref:Pentapeptide repeat-containing protein n=1 Tax=Trichormus variabilis SAG 1403-4b TaxID=447716 RepID=A0A3S1BT40_ANAVA|nr:pentapeptide repeat-containing protein [Trichormus variabilis]RUS94361.1 hypothetical protein DSM107003_38940 [Trichormus variabilis SAG 1403-4b]
MREQEKTFEFTHKSFGEYLTARRIVRELDLIHEQLAERQNNRRKGWDEKEALKQWAILCGISPLNEYLFSFIFDEMRLQEIENVEKWQQTLCNLISFMLREGMPMEELKLTNFHEENRQARNAEEALLVVLHACAIVTEKISEIKWHSPEDFGVWISRLRGQRLDLDYDNQIFCLNYLSYLDLPNCILIHQDFYQAYLQMSNLQEANLHGANLHGANLQMSNLQEANLQEANLQQADLNGANLQEANLQQANLQEANLQQANLQQADLNGANLQEANLQGANLPLANLQGANLPLANLQWANLQGANFQDADLQGVGLQETNLQNANLQGAYLEGVYLEGANVKGTILEGKDLTKLNTDKDSSTV